MSAEILKNAFDPFYSAPLQAWQDFLSFCTTHEYKKNTVLKESGYHERYFYFMLRGSAEVFLLKDVNYVCLDFAFEHHFFGDYMSLLTGAATPLRVMLLDDCELLRLTREDYLKLGQTEIGNVLMRIAAESSFIEKQQQQIDLLTKTAEQRYRELLQHKPHILQRVAQKHIASFLGITPQSYSRIRRKVTQ